jgi:hypothetical protein
MKNLCKIAGFIVFLLIACLGGCSKKASDGNSDGSPLLAQATPSKTGSKSAVYERNEDGEYPMSPQVQFYDGDLKIDKKEAYFTYLPNGNDMEWGYDNAVILNHRMPGALATQSFFFGGTKIRSLFRDSIDKAIEWAAVAKQNKVDSLSKTIDVDGYDIDVRKVNSVFRNLPKVPTMSSVFFYFYIGKEGTFLGMLLFEYGRVGNIVGERYYFFSEKDFTNLKEIFSESYLAEIDKKEADWRKSNADKNALFE